MRVLTRLFTLASVVAVLLLAVTCGSAPLRWFFKGESALRVRVVDKTVPHPDFREHGALFWVLRHDKIASPDGDREWDLDSNYVGFEPDPENYKDHGVGRDLSAADLENVDLTFLADTYGVFRADYEADILTAGADFSPIIYGGLGLPEVELIEAHALSGRHLVAEFNTFGSPTRGAARARLETLLGVRWSGWSGRYFPDLSLESEVPRWARRGWLQQRGLEWDFEGPGYLLVHEDTRLFVLREPEDILSPGLTLHPRTDVPLMAGTIDNVRFHYWFDIVAPAADSVVAASYRVLPTRSGQQLLDHYGVPPEFPAVVIGHEQPWRVYLAGDFSDAAGDMGPHWLEGLPWVNKQLVRYWFPGGAGQEPFYWGFYVPMLRNLLAMADSRLPAQR